jgi:hypothetical protein
LIIAFFNQAFKFFENADSVVACNTLFQHFLEGQSKITVTGKKAIQERVPKKE